MIWLQYILPVLLSCCTGWLTIWLFLKLLFHPRKPIFIAGLKLQGIIPAKQQHIAQALGKRISKEFLSFSTLAEKVTNPENFNSLKPEIEKHIDTFLRERLKETFPMLSMLIGDKTINQLKSAFLLELESLFPVLMKSYLARLEKDIDIEKMITDKITGLSIIQIEEMLYKSAKTQLIYLQLAGACIGLLMGGLHVFLNTQLFS